MASTWSDLKFELIGTGDQSGTWGATTNDNLGIAIQQAIGGKADVTMSSTTITLTLTDTTALQNARALYLNLTGTPGGAATLNVPAVQKAYIVYNNTTGGFAVTVKVSGQTGVSVPNGKSMLLYDNGTDVVDAVTHLSSLTLGSALPIASGGTGTTSTTFVNLASNVTGTLPIANGGTGTTSTTFVNLASNVTGQLPLSNGGTGANLTDPNADRILFWDDSATSVAFLEAGSGLSISGTTLSATASFATPLTVVGNATAGAEIRLPEDTDNGSNYVALKAPDTLASNLTFTLPSADGTNGQVITTNGSGTLSFGTLGVAGGGTGLTSGTSGGVPYFSSANTIASSSALAANAIVLGGGAGVAPATTTTGTGVITAIGNNTNSASGLAVLNASGLLNVAQGGTGAASLTANNVILGNGTSAVQFVAPGSNGNVLTSNGTTWTSAAASGGSSTLTISNKTGAYTVVSGDAGTVINCTSGTFTVSLTAAASLGSGFNCWVWNNGTGTITIDPNGAETIDGVATLTLRQGEGTQIVCNGTNWLTGDKKTMRGYAENFDNTITRPSASGTYSIAIGRSASASGSESVAIGTLTVAGTFSAAIGYTSQANGFGGVAIGSDASASSNYATAIGSNSSGGGPRAAASGATALGGSYAAATDSFAAAIANNTSSYGPNSANGIAIGYQTRSTANYAVAIGSSNQAGGTGAIAIGPSANASGSYSFAAGYQSAASGAGSVALGRVVALYPPNSNADDSFSFGPGAIANTVKGKISFASGDTIASGTYQTGIQLGFLVLRVQTTSATPAVLVSDSSLSAASGTNQILLPDNSAFAFSALIVARRQASGGTQSAAWKIEGLIRREGSAGTTTLVNSATTVLSNTPGWTIAVSADTTNGCLAITATGAAATNIRWVATVQTSEVIYA